MELEPGSKIDLQPPSTSCAAVGSTRESRKRSSTSGSCPEVPKKIKCESDDETAALIALLEERPILRIKRRLKKLIKFEPDLDTIEEGIDEPHVFPKRGPFVPGGECEGDIFEYGPSPEIVAPHARTIPAATSPLRRSTRVKTPSTRLCGEKCPF